MNDDRLLDGLAEIVGQANVLTGEDVTLRWDSYPPRSPMVARCIVRPGTTAEVSAILRLCHRHRAPVVPQGGCTGLVGGAVTRASDVALSLERMRAIKAIDPVGGTIAVEAGAMLQAVQEAASDIGMLYPVDLGARGSATIGGTIATNAGGNSVMRYGMTRDQVLGLEIVLADGTILSSMNRLMKNNTGYDLKQMFVGAEGTLGIVTAAILKLKPGEGDRASTFIGLDDFASVLKLLTHMSARSNGTLTSFEVMWPDFIETVMLDGEHGWPLEKRYNFHVLADLTGDDASGKLEAIVADAWSQGLITDAAVAQNRAQVEAFWAIRDDIAALARHLSPLATYDISLPQGEMEDYVVRLRQNLTKRWADARLIVFGHVADGNLHLLVPLGEDRDDSQVSDLVYGPLQALNGSISAEHGIGLDKRSYLAMSRSPEELAMMRSLKALLDPDNLLNPGKIF